LASRRSRCDSLCILVSSATGGMVGTAKQACAFLRARRTQISDEARGQAQRAARAPRGTFGELLRLGLARAPLARRHCRFFVREGRRVGRVTLATWAERRRGRLLRGGHGAKKRGRRRFARGLWDAHLPSVACDSHAAASQQQGARAARHRSRREPPSVSVRGVRWQIVAPAPAALRLGVAHGRSERRSSAKSAARRRCSPTRRSSSPTRKATSTPSAA
jgi:hypothetical protein